MPWIGNPEVFDQLTNNLGNYLNDKFTSSYDDDVTKYNGSENESLSKKFIRGFWFRHLRGWTNEEKDQAFDLIKSLINYFPEKRARPEKLLNEASIFQYL